MFKMELSTQAGKSSLGGKIVNDKKYILRKMIFEFRNPKFKILYIIALHILL